MLCGSYCLYIALDALGLAPETFEDFRLRLGDPSRTGYSLLQLAQCAESYGARTAALDTDLDTLEQLHQVHARVVLLRGGHFVLVSGYNDETVHVIDPPHEHEIPRRFFESRWAGDVLLISPTELPDLSKRHWWPWLALLTGLLPVGAGVYLFRKVRRTTEETTR